MPEEIRGKLEGEEDETRNPSDAEDRGHNCNVRKRKTVRLGVLLVAAAPIPDKWQSTFMPNPARSSTASRKKTMLEWEKPW